MEWLMLSWDQKPFQEIQIIKWHLSGKNYHLIQPEVLFSPKSHSARSFIHNFSEHIKSITNEIPDGWIEGAIPDEIDLWKVGEPSANYLEMMENQLPRIYKETGETKLDFAYVPEKACKGPKRKFIALIKTSFLDQGSKGKRRKAIRNRFENFIEILNFNDMIFMIR